tara:strand:+ start:1019 stop:1372 length:354 start_codon:yes stop_codon:yes gene_type:complete
MNPLKIRLFKNNYKEPGDNKPAFQNSSISYPDDVFQDDYVFKKGTKHQIGLWKNEDGTLYVEIKEKVDSSAQPQATQQNSQSTYTDRSPDQIMGTPEFQKAQMEKIRKEKEEEDIPF